MKLVQDIFKKIGSSIEPSTTGDGLNSIPIGQSTPAAGTFTQLKQSKGSDVASANALTLGTDGNYFDITGTTSITSIGTLEIGTVVVLHFDGILTLTHNATDLILPGAANITTVAGDEAIFIEYATGDWRCVAYTKADGRSVSSKIAELIQASTDTLTVAEMASTLINNYGQGAANTQTLPPAAKGLNALFIIATIGNAFHIDVQATDKVYLDGVALDDGDKISNTTPVIGDSISIIAFQTGAATYDWRAQTIQGTWIDGGV